MLTITLCGCFAMQINDGKDLGATNMAENYLLTFIVQLPTLFFYRKRMSIRVSFPIRILTILLLWMAAVSFFHSQNIKTSIYPVLNALIPLATLQLMYAYSSERRLSKNMCNLFVVVQFILIVQYFRLYDIAIVAFEDPRLMASYYPMFMLPLVMLHPSKLVRYISILIVTFVIFSSLKRGGLVALGLGLIIYLLFYRHIQSKRISSFVYMLLAFIILGSVFYYIGNSEYGGVVERLAAIQDDGGSGRDEVWYITWLMIQKSKGLSFLLGHGSNGVLNDSPIFFSAHNDFLEAWYDYGFIGFILYAGFMVSLLRYTILLLREKSKFAPAMGMLFTITFTLTMVSHVLIFYLVTFVCMTIGTLLGQDYYNHRKSKVNR